MSPLVVQVARQLFEKIPGVRSTSIRVEEIVEIGGMIGYYAIVEGRIVGPMPRIVPKISIVPYAEAKPVILSCQSAHWANDDLLRASLFFEGWGGAHSFNFPELKALL